MVLSCMKAEGSGKLPSPYVSGFLPRYSDLIAFLPGGSFRIPCTRSVWSGRSCTRSPTCTTGSSTTTLLIQEAISPSTLAFCSAMICSSVCLKIDANRSAGFASRYILAAVGLQSNRGFSDTFSACFCIRFATCFAVAGASKGSVISSRRVGVGCSMRKADTVPSRLYKTLAVLFQGCSCSGLGGSISRSPMLSAHKYSLAYDTPRFSVLAIRSNVARRFALCTSSGFSFWPEYTCATPSMRGMDARYQSGRGLRGADGGSSSMLRCIQSCAGWADHVARVERYFGFLVSVGAFRLPERLRC
mmetsp:Transcript_25863/g.58776  ORF Transcript_25863/g.58776 Transcript_25863/m.58776 type:complete len:302 (-) Transcript_25863:830-1735(-)